MLRAGDVACWAGCRCWLVLSRYNDRYCQAFDVISAIGHVPSSRLYDELTRRSTATSASVRQDRQLIIIIIITTNLACRKPKLQVTEYI